MKKLSAVLLLVGLAFGQSTLRVADDSSSGTYKKMLGEVVSVCSNDSLDLTEAQGVNGGAPGNLEALVNNKADAAFLHSDVYFANAQADPSYNNFQTLVALYPEPIHVLVLRQSKTHKTGWTNFGTVTFNSLADLKGYKVGAAGGGVFTARILTGQGGGGFEVVPYGSGSEIINALNSGDIGAAIFVGAAPLPNIEKLDRNTYKLIGVGEDIAGRLSGVYRTTTISYTGLTNGPLKTLAPMATLLTRKFRTPAKIEAQAKLRNCFTQHLSELQDTGSPNWQAVEPGDHGVASIPWLELPNNVSNTSSKRPK